MLSNWSFAISTLLTHLFSETYHKKKIEHIGVQFATEAAYQLFPNAVRFRCHCAAGRLNYDGFFEREKIEGLNHLDRTRYLWTMVNIALTDAAQRIGDAEFLNAVETVYHLGLERHLCADYKMISSKIDLWGRLVDASLWAVFDDEYVKAVLSLAYQGREIYRKEVDQCKLGISAFLVSYKKIEASENKITIKVHRDWPFSKTKIEIPENIFSAITP